MGPACHPLCTIKFLFLNYFWLLIFGHLPFSFDLMPRLKRWGTCWLMGPACHPLCAIKVYFLVFFSPSDFWLFPFSFDPLPPWKRWVAADSWDPHVILYVQSTFFFFWSQAAFETLRPLLLIGTRMSSSMYNKVFFLDYLWLLIFCHLPFSFDLMPPLKRWVSYWLMGPACHPLRTIKVSFLGVIFDP